MSTRVAAVDELPSSAEEGRAAAAAEARVVLVNRIIVLTHTTPALRATPPQLRRGARAKIDRMIRRPGGNAADYLPFPL